MSTSHAIPSRLDAPAKFLIFDADVGLAFGFGFLTGIVVLDNMPIGVLLGAGLGWGWSRIKSGKHPAFQWHLLYWYVPWSLRRTPPSFLREMVG